MNPKQNPTGLAAMGTTVLVWAAIQVGVELPNLVAAAIVGLVAGAVSYFTPRHPE